MMHMTPHSPVEYWCHAADFLDKVRRVLSQPKLNGISPLQQVYGSTVDISRFGFPWFSPVWYYDPTGTADFPNDGMKPGFFLDIADNTGDAFSYRILPAKLWTISLSIGTIPSFIILYDLAHLTVATLHLSSMLETAFYFSMQQRKRYSAKPNSTLIMQI